MAPVRPFFFPPLVFFLTGGLIALTSGFGEAGQERNPFALPPGIQKKAAPGAGASAAGPTVSAEVEPTFVLTTVLIGKSTKVAAINGKLVREGERIGEFRVARISPGQVVLIKGKDKKIISVDNGRKWVFQKTDEDRRVLGQSK